jgi:hypothetical protein
MAFDQTRIIEDAEVVGQQVGRDIELLAQLRRGSVRCVQLIDDRYPMRIRERGMDPRPDLRIGYIS